MTDNPPDTRKDREAIDRLISNLYQAISGDNDAERDWELDRSLYHPGAVLGPNSWRDRPRGVYPLDEYLSQARRLLGDSPFHEWETEREVWLTGDVATVISHYAAAESPGGEVIKSGINHFLLMKLDGEWRVLAGAWDS